MTACIVGWAHTPFGKLANESDRSDVEEIVLGHFNSGFSPQDFTASLVLQILRPICASSAQRAWRMLAPRAPPPCTRA